MLAIGCGGQRMERIGNLEPRFGRRLCNPATRRLSEQFETRCAVLASTFVIALFDNHSFLPTCGAVTLEVSEPPVDHMYGPIP